MSQIMLGHNLKNNELILIKLYMFMHHYLLNELFLSNILPSRKVTLEECGVAHDITLPLGLSEVNTISIIKM